MKNAKELHKRWIKNPDYIKAYKALDEEFGTTHALIKAQVKVRLANPKRRPE